MGGTGFGKVGGFMDPGLNHMTVDIHDQPFPDGAACQPDGGESL